MRARPGIWTAIADRQGCDFVELVNRVCLAVVDSGSGSLRGDSSDFSSTGKELRFGCKTTFTDKFRISVSGLCCNDLQILTIPGFNSTWIKQGQGKADFHSVQNRNLGLIGAKIYLDFAGLQSDGGHLKFEQREKELNFISTKESSVFEPKRNHLNLLERGQDYLCGLSRRNLHTSTAMAKSKFEYVKQFEVEDRCMPNCWIVIRIDGKSFHRFSDTHHFVKPNDERALGLMSRAAQTVMEDFKDVVLSYGQSDEYSFVFKKNCTMYNRRGSKIMTNLVSLFSSAFVMNWPRYFATQELQYPPSFDARVVLYPSDQNLKDYLSWRQADCHINNLYNTVFWKLVQERCLTPAQSQERLKGTLSSDKNEILFSEFNINYNNLPELYRKGTILIRSKDENASPSRIPSTTTTSSLNHSMSKSSVKYRSPITILNCDIIGRQFWEDHPEILDPKKG